MDGAETLGDDQTTKRNCSLQKQALRVCRCALNCSFGAARRTRRGELAAKAARIKQQSPCPAPIMAILPRIPPGGRFPSKKRSRTMDS